jgi:hypothetical protein
MQKPAANVKAANGFRTGSELVTHYFKGFWKTNR